VPLELIPDDDVVAPPPESLAAIRAERGLPPVRLAGVNVVGHFAAESGIGESARLLVSALRAGRVPHELVGYTGSAARQADPFGTHESSDATRDVNVVCINADELPPFVQGPGRTLFDGRPTVGLWMWEVDEFPSTMAAAARYVDEVWMGSEHAAASVRGAVDVPVFTFPLPVVPLDPPALSRADLHLPEEAFVFLFAFSFHSVVERKNPFALVEAFTRAFAPGEGPRLVIKSIHGDRNLPQLERLRAAVAHRDDVEIRDGVVSRAEHASLVHACDAYVSLHRAEGFGLTTAEAMAIGKPVIATAYSGTLENMTEENSWLVPYELVEVGPDATPYPPTARWAEPDVDAAAAAMREVFANPDEAAARGQRAARDIALHHGPAARVKFINDRLRALAALRAVAPTEAPPSAPLARRAARRLVGYGRQWRPTASPRAAR
jgi:glycosyltransferase involved in cell wall biosynthesis